jgi:DNA primase
MEAFLTPQELAALPKGTRVKFDLNPDEGFDYGTVVQAGSVVQITWDEDSVTSIIDTKRGTWENFIVDILLDTPPESV